MNKRVCVVIPTFNNDRTLLGVIQGVSQHVTHIIVVNDGSTDGTAHLLDQCPISITVITLLHNYGKGKALCEGFREARKQGFDYAITIDSDGQHSTADLPLFIAAIRKYSGYLIVGNRFYHSRFSESANQNMNRESKFANRFSNFWFHLQTGIRLDDTQTGFRAYPLQHLPWLSCITSRYEAELELLVFAAWHNVGIHSIPIQVHYPPQEERVSHFRPYKDFARISLLNTALCGIAFLYAWPKWIIRTILTGVVLVLLFVIMLFVQLILFIYFNSHHVTERERLNYHSYIQKVSHWLLKHIPGVTTQILNKSGENFLRPAVIISNHQSHLDLLCIMMLTPRLVIMTKKWVWNNPLYGLAIRYAEYLPISQDIDTNERLLQRLSRRGYSIMIFPEGTRSADLEIHRFSQGAFYLARKLALDIVPVVLHGTGTILNKQAKHITPGEITVEIKPRVCIAELKCGSTSMETAKIFRRKYIEWTQN